MNKITIIKHTLILSSIFLYFFYFNITQSKASTLANRLSGRILLSVEENGEAWYLSPVDSRRYYLGRPEDAFSIMRELGLGITELDFQKIAQAGMKIDGDLELSRKLAGRILLQVEKNGEAWYLNPVDLKKYYLGRPEDAFSIMRKLGLGISQANLALIHKPGLSESINQYSSYEHKKIETSKGSFSIDLVSIDLKDPQLKIKSLVAGGANPCISNSCQAQALADYVFPNKAWAGINASYFCASATCQPANYFFYPVYDSESETLVNASELKYWTTGPLIAFDKDNHFYYFSDSRDFAGLEQFEKKYNTKLQALVGNKPRLLEKGMNVLIDWDLDESQRTGKHLRSAIAYREDLNNLVQGELYLIIVRQANLDDLVSVLQALNLDYALNLDGGASSALIYNGEYMLGPGRNIPNALIFSY